MSPSAIQSLAERLAASDPSRPQEQREIFERIRELRGAFDGPMHPDGQRYLEAASMLVAYLARMGGMAGEDVRSIAVRLLHCAAEVDGEQPQAGELLGALLPSGLSPAASKLGHGARLGQSVGERHSATDLVGDMMLGQILLERGQIFDEHIHQAVKVQRVTQMRIGDVFVKIGACSRSQVDDALKHQASLRRVRQNLSGQEPHVSPPDTRGIGLKLVGEAMLGEILVERGIVTRSQLDRALDAQRATGGRIGEVLVKLGTTTMQQIEFGLRIQGRERRFVR